MEARLGKTMPVRVTRVRAGEVTHKAKQDYVAAEEPMEIRLVTNEGTRKLAVTMRTPGADFELAAGFLYSEGIVTDRNSIRSISYCVDEDLDEDQQYNVVNVNITDRLPDDFAPLERHFMVSSACGVCGKASIEALNERDVRPVAFGAKVVPLDVLASLTDKLRAAQQVFDRTGGLHAAALFDLNGHLLQVKEDIGRHNAFDKLVGWALQAGKLPLTDTIVLVSGRASYELVQKAASAGIPTFCAVSAPSSLAVQVAQYFQVTLIGFLRGANFNVYTHPVRIQLPGIT